MVNSLSSVLKVLTQEDAHICVPSFDGEESGLFGVFDGHGGCEVARFVAKNFEDILRNSSKYQEKEYT